MLTFFHSNSASITCSERLKSLAAPLPTSPVFAEPTTSDSVFVIAPTLSAVPQMLLPPSLSALNSVLPVCSLSKESKEWHTNRWIDAGGAVSSAAGSAISSVLTSAASAATSAASEALSSATGGAGGAGGM